MAKITNPHFVKDRERFLFRTDFYGFFSKLPRGEQGDLIMAIIEYHKFGEVKTPLTDRARWSFDFIQEVLDGNSLAYIKQANVNRENGKNGGRPKKTQENPKNPMGYDGEEENPKNPKNPKNLDIDIGIGIDSDIGIGIDSGVRETKRKRFSPPTLEEVKAYCLERGNKVDAERFIDYYTSNGWKVGKNSMKDWKSAVKLWERNEYTKGGVTDDKYMEYDSRGSKDEGKNGTGTWV